MPEIETSDRLRIGSVRPGPPPHSCSTRRGGRWGSDVVMTATQRRGELIAKRAMSVAVVCKHTQKSTGFLPIRRG